VELDFGARGRPGGGNRMNIEPPPVVGVGCGVFSVNRRPVLSWMYIIHTYIPPWSFF
jgi:hypothetical protein